MTYAYRQISLHTSSKHIILSSLLLFTATISARQAVKTSAPAQMYTYWYSATLKTMLQQTQRRQQQLQLKKKKQQKHMSTGLLQNKEK